MIKCVIFDIDDTMYSYTKCNEIGMKAMDRYVQEHFAVPVDEFRSQYRRMREDMEARLGFNNAAAHSRHIRIQNLLEEWNQPIFPHVSDMYWCYWGTILDVCEPEPGLLDCMKALKEKGIRLGVGSDMTTMVQYEKLKRLGAAPYMDFIVTSQEAGVEKPHPDFMKRCLEKARVKPEECLFIGDNFKKDVEGAAAAGMHGVWYNPTEKRLPEDSRLNTDEFIQIHHFDELLISAL